MADADFHPTPYSDVNICLSLLLSNVRAVLEEQFVGLYLGGSLAVGDFDSDRSDIDFIAVTVDALPHERIAALGEMHTRLRSTDTRWAGKLDGSYVPKGDLRRWTSEHAPCPFVEDDAFQVTNQGSAIIQRHIIREHAVIVAGPHTHTLIHPVDSGELQRAVKDMLEK